MNSLATPNTLNNKPGEGCYHCGLPVSPASRFSMFIDGTEQEFCCPACKSVAAAIIDGGLGEYYQFREKFSDKPEETDDSSHIDELAWQSQFIQQDAQGNSSIELLISGIHCAACTWLLEKYLATLPGVNHVGVSLAEHKAIIRWHDQNFSLDALLKTIRHIGYQAEPFTSSAAKQKNDDEKRLALRRLGIAGLVMMQVGMIAGAMYTGAFDDIVNSGIHDNITRTADTQWGHWLRWTSLIISLPILYSAWPIFSGAWRGIKRAQFGMDVSVSLALLLAFIASCYATITGSGEIYFDAVTMFVFLLLGSRFLEMQARHYRARGNDDIRSLLPATALKLIDNGQSKLVPISALQIGDSVLVKPGQIIPGDGVLKSETALIDESMITGESTPQRKQINDVLIAGTHNTEQPLQLSITALPGQLRLDHIAKLTDIAAQTKPAFAQLADRLANYFVITVLLIAAVVLFIGWQHNNPFYIANTIAVLVVSCPCALSLAMPTALAIATNSLRQRGLLITASHVWEALDSITDVVFDKTGTLTTGAPRCVEIINVDTNKDDVLQLVASLEAQINHPIAEAFKNIAVKTPAKNINSVTGCGVSGEINGMTYKFGKAVFAKPDSMKTPQAPDEKTGWLLLADDKNIIAWLRIEESLKPDAKMIIDALKKQSSSGHSPSIHLLSGDQQSNVETIAAQLGITQWQANATPEDKLAYLTALQKNGRKVLMIGDGINDIPILAQADISLAVTSASELAKLRADAILLNNDLLPILTLWQATAKTRKIIRQNLLWALLYNVIAIPLAAMGMVAPWLAAIGMSASSLIVVGNAWRLRK